MKKFKKGDKVKVLDAGLAGLRETIKRMGMEAKPNHYGMVVEEDDGDGLLMICFPIGDEDPNEHSQVALYPIEEVVMRSEDEKSPIDTLDLEKYEGNK